MMKTDSKKKQGTPAGWPGNDSHVAEQRSGSGGRGAVAAANVAGACKRAAGRPVRGCWVSLCHPNEMEEGRKNRRQWRRRPLLSGSGKRCSMLMVALLGCQAILLGSTSGTSAVSLHRLTGSGAKVVSFHKWHIPLAVAAQRLKDSKGSAQGRAGGEDAMAHSSGSAKQQKMQAQRERRRQRRQPSQDRNSGFDQSGTAQEVDGKEQYRRRRRFRRPRAGGAQVGGGRGASRDSHASSSSSNVRNVAWWDSFMRSDVLAARTHYYEESEMLPPTMMDMVSVPERRPTPARRFAVATLGRSGSTYLTNMLNSHPDIRMYSEIFHENEIQPDGSPKHCLYDEFNVSKGPEFGKNLADGYFDTTLCEQRYCQYYAGDCSRVPEGQTCSNEFCRTLAAAKAAGTLPRTVGIKMLTGSQLHAGSLALKDEPIIVLLRKQMMLRAMSAMHLHESQIANLDTSRVDAVSQLRAVQPLKAKPPEIWSYLGQCISMERRLRRDVAAITDTILPVWYEDLVMAADRKDWFSPMSPWFAITQFLGVDPAPLSTTLVPVHNVTMQKLLYPTLDDISTYVGVRTGVTEYEGQQQFDHT